MKRKVMITRDTYEKVLSAVEEEISLPCGWLLGSKTEDATDARYILCHYLQACGMSSAQIQRITGLRKSTVNIMLAKGKERMERRRITYLWWLQIGRRLEDLTDKRIDAYGLPLPCQY